MNKIEFAWQERGFRDRRKGSESVAEHIREFAGDRAANAYARGYRLAEKEEAAAART